MQKTFFVIVSIHVSGISAEALSCLEKEFANVGYSLMHALADNVQFGGNEQGISIEGITGKVRPMSRAILERCEVNVTFNVQVTD